VESGGGGGGGGGGCCGSGGAGDLAVPEVDGALHQARAPLPVGCGRLVIIILFIMYCHIVYIVYCIREVCSLLFIILHFYVVYVEYYNTAPGSTARRQARHYAVDGINRIIISYIYSVFYCKIHLDCIRNEGAGLDIYLGAAALP
jgi:hypothetical protein